MLRIAIISFALLSNTAFAYIYKFVDDNGLVHYTDQPETKGYKRIIKTVDKPKKFSFFRDYPVSAKRQHFSSVNKEHFSSLIEQAAYKYQVDPKLVHAVVQTESAYNSDAVSRAGAVGLMQLMPATAKRFGVYDRNDPDQNVDGGTRYLKYLLDLFGPNLQLAVAAYNAGENAVMKHNYSIPPYRETQNYVRQVLSLYNNS
jgi:soluble lytic murein transglycosylase-like protein